MLYIKKELDLLYMNLKIKDMDYGEDLHLDGFV